VLELAQRLGFDLANALVRDVELLASDAATVLAQLPAAFEHFNEVHPHSSLKMRSPREFESSGGIRPLRHANQPSRKQRYIANKTGPGIRGRDQRWA
jgi:hypothetical protein